MTVKEKDDTRIKAIWTPALGKQPLSIALAESVIPAGFPSPAEDSQEILDIAAHIVRHPASTFFMRVSGDSMTGVGIFDGDLLVVDRSLEPASGDIVVAVLNGEFTVKRLVLHHGRTELVAENPKFRKITLTDSMDFEVWGVVTGTYKSFR